MIKKSILFLLLLITLSFPFQNPWKFVFTNGTPLAVQQESLLVKYNRGDTSISKDTLRDLRINWWVRTANKTAPGNLIIRQYCIIDLYEGTPSHKDKIERLVFLLSGGKTHFRYRTWAESYTYWLYTRYALDPWLKKFKSDSLVSMSNNINDGFAYTSYQREDGKYYPAPFGDLWESPLDSIGQQKATFLYYENDDAQIKNVKRFYENGKIAYIIKPFPVGLNGHCETRTSVRIIKYYRPDNFKYYEGYDKKYKDQKAEWKDLLNPIRILTIPFIW